MSQLAQLMIFARQKLFRECLAGMLAEVGRWVVLEATDDFEGMARRVDELGPDVLLIDLLNAGELVAERIRAARRQRPAIRVLILGGEDGYDAALACIEAGAHGYVSKQAPLDELSAAIDRVTAGEASCSSPLAYAAFARLAERAEENRRSRHLEALMLTPRELEVLGLIADGHSNKEIAEQLFLSIYTVKNHVHHILEKLRVDCRAQAVELAHARRWLDLDRPQPTTETQPREERWARS